MTIRAKHFATFTTLAVGIPLSACSLPSDTDVETRALSSTLSDAEDTHLYLRCNATGWDLTEATHLQPSVEGRIASLTFEVDEDWMVSDGDNCIITETDTLHGWSSTTTAWTVAEEVNPPETADLSQSWTQFRVQFPSKGTYRAVVDRSAGILTIAPPGTWVHPYDGAYPTDWVPGGYVDRDGRDGFLFDYADGERVLDNHRGVDYGVGSFRAMDDGLQIVAVTGGTVVHAVDEHPDRVTEAEDDCASVSNDVIVETPDGTEIIYGHLKQDSILVDVGQTVNAGDPLGVVGSSGCSSGPHLHLEARDASGTLLDPFELGLWAEPLPYAAPLSVMEVIVVDSFFQEEESRVQDPGPNATTFAPGGEIGVAAYVAGGTPAEDFTMRLVDPSGAIHASASPQFDSPAGQSTWVFNWFLGQQLGTWHAEFVTNGEVAVSYPFEVVAQ